MENVKVSNYKINLAVRATSNKVSEDANELLSMMEKQQSTDIAFSPKKTVAKTFGNSTNAQAAPRQKQSIFSSTFSTRNKTALKDTQNGKSMPNSPNRATTRANLNKSQGFSTTKPQGIKPFQKYGSKRDE